MNIFQMRHKVLEAHLGERFTSAQLRAEFLKTFPGVNPSSINPSDCFNTPSKKAGCTCKECTRLGGFAVNRDGIVDMGASGWAGISSAYVPTGNGRRTQASTFNPPAGAGLSWLHGSLRIDPQTAAQCIRRYNSSSYRGSGNTTLDRDAYDLFRNGLSRDTGQFLEQIAFVGERYGGAQERFVSIRNEAALIVSKLLPLFDNWLKAVGEVEPLVQRVPDQTTLDLLFSPFVGTRQWPVWASKVLHFLRPGVFPILDSNAKKPLGLNNLVNSSHGYHQFCSKFRDAMLANPDALKCAHEADSGESPSDLKLLDKILYQIGIDMN
jgi:hypothetical protein